VDCAYEATGASGGKAHYVCTVCGHTRRSAYPPNLLHHSCSDAPTQRTKGVGDFLKESLEGAGFKQGGCGCASMQAKMNAWGPAGCIEHMAEILDHLQAEATKRKQPFDRDLVEIAVLMAIGGAEEASRASQVH